ncbi:tripartite tricarboxylate transporter substrate binding protein [Bordetella petrii]|uniref:tripartite tricarboxylate transporter substrate binding protein n=1 Tax=Bordetella petrii TaxID=94624 RepID=UPI001A975969|nr:tripartite tricarboxylate transporter substrate binding protein [Bordetella petrii]MBO1114581.1 tripartite tricarboxylate transporter substrate binding protein [Bordetella petrii]
MFTLISPTAGRLPAGKRLLAALAATLALWGGAVQAAAWPSQPLRIIVPYTAGGAVDALARLTGQYLAPRVGQPILIENKPGAGSNIGMEAAAHAAPDGYTLLMAANSLATNNSLYPDLRFNGLRDFAPVAQIGYAPLMIVVPADSPIHSLRELLETARKSPGKLSYASSGNGSSSHLAGESLKIAAGIDVLHVPYRGAAPAMTDLLGGRISYMAVNPAEAAQHIKAGRLRALAVAAPQRLAILPDVPTAAEAGLPGYEEAVWWGLVAPAGTPAAIVTRLNHDVRAALDEPAMKARLDALGVIERPGPPDQFAAFIKAETARARQVIQTAHIKPN